MNACKSLLTNATVALLLAWLSAAAAAPSYVHVSDVTNASNPSRWQSESFDITPLVAGTGNAQLSFDIRNDAPLPAFFPDATQSDVLFGAEGGNYFVHFHYLSGADTSHWRNVVLLIDDLTYRDQYAAFNQHLGDEFLGTAFEGNTGPFNIVAQPRQNPPYSFVATGFDAGTYVMAPVPLPGAGGLFGATCPALGLRHRRRRVPSARSTTTS
jgi:hypothetical protein